MELQAVTAGPAAGLTLITIAMFMLGMYLTSGRDLCTGYWAIAAVLMALASIAPFPFYGTRLGIPAIWFASVSVVAGGVFWWWGIRLFFGRSAPAAGWWIIAADAIIVGATFWYTWEKQPRLIVFGASVVFIVSLLLREAWRGNGAPMNIGRTMTLVGFALPMVSMTGRSVYFLVVDKPVTPLTNGVANVALLYLLPMLGVLVSAVGALLMYFQRTIAEKDYLAAHDDLTRLFNRRALVEEGQRALAAGAAERRAVSLLLIDVDHFKTVNDTLGHEAGDRALCAIAEALAAACRRTDVLGRHGGEEFCIVCRDTGAEEALRLGERLLRTVEAIERPPGLDGPFSISIGIATDGGDWDAMLLQADRALYAAKAAGRGRAVAA